MFISVYKSFEGFIPMRKRKKYMKVFEIAIFWDYLLNYATKINAFSKHRNYLAVFLIRRI